MRCFIAVELPEYIKDILSDVQKKIGNDHAKVHLVAKKNLHLTLQFLGDIEEEQLKKVQDILDEVKENKFTVALDQIGWYPHEHKIRVLWVGLKPEQDIFSLQGEIDLTLGSLFRKDERFSVHLTLGRVKSIKERDTFLSLLNALEIERTEFLVDSFSLFKSELRHGGPQYTLLKKYTLA